MPQQAEMMAAKSQNFPVSDQEEEQTEAHEMKSAKRQRMKRTDAIRGKLLAMLKIKNVQKNKIEYLSVKLAFEKFITNRQSSFLD